MKTDRTCPRRYVDRHLKEHNPCGQPLYTGITGDDRKIITCVRCGYTEPQPGGAQ